MLTTTDTRNRPLAGRRHVARRAAGYRFDQPPEVVGGIFIMGIIAAVVEWLTIKSK
jgi:hypothetical protein